MHDQLGLYKEDFEFSSVKSIIEGIRRGDVPPTVRDINMHLCTLLNWHSFEGTS